MSSPKFLPAPDNASSLSPAEARAIFRKNGYYGTTSGFCVGHAQANLTMIPSHLADDYEEFCRKNHCSLPLLYRSQPGETGTSLANDSDIKWDVPRYSIFSHGRVVDDRLDLDGFSSQWSDIVSFYVGCSFSFEHELMQNGIALPNLEQKMNCSMYNSNTMLENHGVFKDVPMTVSMRPVPKNLLERAVAITAQYPDHHGAPIHIGNPARIGIADINKTYQGERQVSIEPGSVCVFWACGVSNREAIMAAKPSLAFTHYPGSMFIADAQSEKKQLDDTIKVVQLSRPSDPFFASLVGSKTAGILSKLELSLIEDPNQRDVGKLLVDGDLLKAVLSLSHAKRVAVTTGFPANTELPVKQETDGVGGALSICHALLVLGKEVSLIADSGNQDLFEKCVEKMVQIGGLKSKVPVMPFSKAKDLMLSAPKDNPVFDCLLAIERSGKSSDGHYYSMRKNDLSSLVEPIDKLFDHARNNPLVSTIGIGDGGNELGMGKVIEMVRKNVEFGETIACVTATDFLVSAGVSDWAGYAMAVGLFAVSQCPVHWRYVNHAVNAETPLNKDLSEFIPSNDQVRVLLEFMNDQGIMDGMNKGGGSVDNQTIVKILNKIDQLKQMI